MQGLGKEVFLQPTRRRVDARHQTQTHVLSSENYGTRCCSTVEEYANPCPDLHMYHFTHSHSSTIILYTPANDCHLHQPSHRSRTSDCELKPVKKKLRVISR